MMGTKKLKFTAAEPPRPVASETDLKNKRKLPTQSYEDMIPKKTHKKVTYDNPNTRFLGCTDNQEKDANYATNFFEKVEEIFAVKNCLENFDTFQQILLDFNPANDKVSDLYRKMEALFLPDYPELVDLFLTFLLPGQAAEIGKFFDHFILTNMNTFFNKLKIYFNKQPAQIRKVHDCLNRLISEPNITMENVKAQILPLLKGNLLLTQWFLEIFPNEKPRESQFDEYEIMTSCKKIMNDPETNEIFEELHPNDANATEVDESCLVKYNNGRIICGRTTIVPTKLSFLANDAVIKRDPTMIKRSNTLKCVHEINKYAESKIKVINELSLIQNAANDLNKLEDADISINQNSSKKEVELPESLPEMSNSNSLKLCSKMTLRAHAIRLNPLIYATKDEKYSDVLTLLIPTNSSTDKSTPKPLSPIKKNINKLSNIINDKSLTNRPQKHSNTASEDLVIDSNVVPSSSVNANKVPMKNIAPNVTDTIQDNSVNTVVTEAKRFKSLTLKVAGGENVRKHREELKRKIIRMKKARNRLTIKTKFKKSAPPLPSTSVSDAQEKPNIIVSEIEEPQIIKDSELAPKSEKHIDDAKDEIIWTRDEDKLILEEIRKGFDDVEELFTRIQAQLPDRLLDAISVRYAFLMDVLKKLQKN